MSEKKFFTEMTRMMLAASSWSGSWQYLLARTRQASALRIWSNRQKWKFGIFSHTHTHTHIVVSSWISTSHQLQRVISIWIVQHKGLQSKHIEIKKAGLQLRVRSGFSIPKWVLSSGHWWAHVCIWCCEHARFCVEVFYALYINFHSFIHSFMINVYYYY